MDRDTEEWLRPWRDDAATATDTPPSIGVIVEEEGEVAAPRVAVRRTRVVRPSTLAVGDTGSSDRRVIVRPDAPGGREVVEPARVAAPRVVASASASAPAPVVEAQPTPEAAAPDASAHGASPSERPSAASSESLSAAAPDAAPADAPDASSEPASDAPEVASTTPPIAIVQTHTTPSTPVVEQPATGRRTVATIAVAAGLVGALIGTGGTLVAADQLDLFRGGSAGGTAVVSESGPVRAPIVESREVAVGETVVAAVASAVLPSVVRIDVLADSNDPDLGAVQVPIGVGSGVIYRSDGYILTNNHVVDGADAVIVRFSDGRSEPAEIVGTDPLSDLAVLRVDADGLVAVNLRDDVPLQVGETAVAIGSPFGLDASVTAGVVSALNRDLEVPGEPGEGAFVIPALIQTDAAINPGNSGGALVDGNGRLIGINTAILTGSGGSQGVGFAIPTSRAVISANQLIDKGFVAHPFLGISGLDVTNEVAARYREDFGIDLNGGALVDQVVDGSGAALGGVQPGDVIVSIGGQGIGSMTDVIGAILRFETGETLDVVVLREGERLELDVTLGERPR